MTYVNAYKIRLNNDTKLIYDDDIWTYLFKLSSFTCKTIEWLLLPTTNLRPTSSILIVCYEGNS